MFATPQNLKECHSWLSVGLCGIAVNIYNCLQVVSMGMSSHYIKASSSQITTASLNKLTSHPNFRSFLFLS